METPNGVRSTVGGRFIPSGLPSSSGFYPWASLPDGRTRPTGPLSSPAWADGTSAVCLATCLLSIPACLRRGGPVLPLVGLRHPTGIFPWNSGTVSPFWLATSISQIGYIYLSNITNYQYIFLTNCPKKYYIMSMITTSCNSFIIVGDLQMRRVSIVLNFT